MPCTIQSLSYIKLRLQRERLYVPDVLRQRLDDLLASEKQ